MFKILGDSSQSRGLSLEYPLEVSPFVNGRLFTAAGGTVTAINDFTIFLWLSRNSGFISNVQGCIFDFQDTFFINYNNSIGTESIFIRATKNNTTMNTLALPTIVSDARLPDDKLLLLGVTFKNSTAGNFTVQMFIKSLDGLYSASSTVSSNLSISTYLQETGNTTGSGATVNIGRNASATVSGIYGNYGTLFVRDHGITSTDIDNIIATKKYTAPFLYSGGNMTGNTGCKTILNHGYGFTRSIALNSDPAPIANGVNVSWAFAYNSYDATSANRNLAQNYTGTNFESLSSTRAYQLTDPYTEFSDLVFDTDIIYSGAGGPYTESPNPLYTSNNSSNMPKTYKFAQDAIPDEQIKIAIGGNSRGIRATGDNLSIPNVTRMFEGDSLLWAQNYMTGVIQNKANATIGFLNATPFSGNSSINGYIGMFLYALNSNDASSVNISASANGDFARFGWNSGETVSVNGPGEPALISLGGFYRPLAVTANNGINTDSSTDQFAIRNLALKYPGSLNLRYRPECATSTAGATAVSGDWVSVTMDTTLDTHTFSTGASDAYDNSTKTITIPGSGGFERLDTSNKDQWECVYVAGTKNIATIESVSSNVVNGNVTIVLTHQLDGGVSAISDTDVLHFGPYSYVMLSSDLGVDAVNQAKGMRIEPVDNGNSGEVCIVGLGAYAKKNGIIGGFFGWSGNGWVNQINSAAKNSLKRIIQAWDFDIIGLTAATQANTAEEAQTAITNLITSSDPNAEIVYFGDGLNGSGNAPLGTQVFLEFNEWALQNAPSRSKSIAVDGHVGGGNFLDQFSATHRSDNAHFSSLGAYTVAKEWLRLLKLAIEESTEAPGRNVTTVDNTGISQDYTSVPVVLASKIKRSMTRVSFTPISDPHTSTTWQFRHEFDPTSRIRVQFTTNSNGVINRENFPYVTMSGLNYVDLQLDRQYNWYVRVKENDNGYSDWVFIDLSGEIRLVGGKHRDKYQIEETNRGKNITSVNPQFTIRNTSRGKDITQNIYPREKSRDNNKGGFVE